MKVYWIYNNLSLAFKIKVFLESFKGVYKYA